MVSKKLEKDGMVGMAVAGGAALAVGGQVQRFLVLLLLTEGVICKLE